MRSVPSLYNYEQLWLCVIVCQKWIQLSCCRVGYSVIRELLWLRHGNISGTQRKRKVSRWKPLTEDRGEDNKLRRHSPCHSELYTVYIRALLFHIFFGVQKILLPFQTPPKVAPNTLEYHSVTLSIFTHAVRIVTRFRSVPYTNVGRDTGYHYWDVSQFHSVHPDKCHDRFHLHFQVHCSQVSYRPRYGQRH
jgi:hypothetical protein